MFSEDLELNSYFVTNYLVEHSISSLCKYISSKGYTLKVFSFIEEGCFGYFDMTKREIGIVLFDYKERRPLSLAELCFYLAHESRHLSHSILGKFSAYYNYEFKVALENGSWDPFNEHDFAMLPNPIVGFAAESDCDAWAEEYVKLHVDRSFEYDGVYPISAVAHYGEYMCKRNDDVSGARLEFLSIKEKFDKILALKKVHKTKSTRLDKLMVRIEVLLLNCQKESFVSSEALKLHAIMTKIKI